MKADLRVLKTKERLYESLIALMEQEPFYEIRIVSLLQHSGVSKNTFYRHYQSLYELYYEMMDQTIQSFCYALREIDTRLSNSSYYLIEQSLRHERILTVALKSTSPNILVDLLQKHYREMDASRIDQLLTALLPGHAQYWDETLYYSYGAISTMQSISYVLSHKDLPVDTLANTLYTNSYLYSIISSHPVHSEIW